MDPHPLANLFKRSNYDEPIASELSALDYIYGVLLEIRESGYCDEVLYKVIHDRSLNKSMIAMMLLSILLMSIVLMICKTQSLGMLVLLCPLLVAMIMIGVIHLMILKIYLSPMLNMRLIIMFAIVLKVGLDVNFRSHIFGECSIL